MTDARAYRLYIRPGFKKLTFGMLVIFTVVGLLLLTGVFQSHDGNGPPRTFGLFWLGIVGWNWYVVLSLTHTIAVSETGQVEFISVVRRRRTALREIESIKPDSQFGFLVIKTNDTRFRILNQFDGFHDFIIRLKTANPAVELRGC